MKKREIIFFSMALFASLINLIDAIQENNVSAICGWIVSASFFIKTIIDIKPDSINKDQHQP